MEAGDRRPADGQHVEGDPVGERLEEVLEASADGVLELCRDDVCWYLDQR